MNNRIILVDDEMEFLELMSIHIENNSNFKVVPTHLPGKVIPLIKEHNPFAVVTDTNMPELNGVDLLKLIKESHPTIPVIVHFSGLKGSNLNERDILRMGASNVISKHQAVRDLLPILQQLQIYRF